MQCMAPGCNQFYHLFCFIKKYGDKSFTALEPGQVMCTKKCYSKDAGLGRVQHTWNHDGASGITDSCTSTDILLDWPMVPGNYSLWWHRKDNGSEKKKQIAQSIANLMNIVKVKLDHDGNHMMNKLQHFEEQFCRAHDCANMETNRNPSIKRLLGLVIVMSVAKCD